MGVAVNMSVSPGVWGRKRTKMRDTAVLKRVHAPAESRRAVNSELEAQDTEDGSKARKADALPQTMEHQVESIETLRREEDTEFAGQAVAVWVAAAMAFGAGIGYFAGVEKAEEFFAGYLLEQSLSVDNLFVFILIFKYFKVRGPEQETVLNYGIWTAAVLRGIMCFAGVELVDNFKPVMLGFAAILLYSAYGILAGASDDDEDEDDLHNNKVVQICRRLIKVSDEYDGNKFFTVKDGVRTATPLLLVLAIVELSDVVFAVDSIPAVFGVTLDPFIVYTSNMFAIANLRAVYQFIAVVIGDLRFLEKAVAVVLGYIGSKMVLDYVGFEIPTSMSLAIVATVLGGGIGLSYLLPEDAKPEPRLKQDDSPGADKRLWLILATADSALGSAEAEAPPCIVCQV
eukprot:CAMPEP_0177609036 /NCGR_PEP_ID=MMETSP0419_2-20121207/18836_1 /TAXON_ID=582737 /ORGANISM="Tetraselmis sp., Strain GSL018" /LENGTH=399 /DNA_ID=CAMNT_0019103857 /DNA_START=382 /DNA_END=1582 /DNA_ORIENTATION=-